MRLYMMRHGETDWNKVRRLQGKSDIPLNEFGRMLAEKTREGLREVPFDLVITSPLSRARETAMIVKGDREIPVIEDARIEEMCFGAYEGLYCKGENFNIPDEEFHRFFDDPVNYHPAEDGETFPEFCGRVEGFLQELFQKKEYEDSTVLISVHGAVLCAMIRWIRKYPMSMFWGKGVHKNCGVTVVDVKEGAPEIVCENMTYYEEETMTW